MRFARVSLEQERCNQRRFERPGNGEIRRVFGCLGHAERDRKAYGHDAELIGPSVEYAIGQHDALGPLRDEGKYRLVHDVDGPGGGRNRADDEPFHEPRPPAE